MTNLNEIFTYSDETYRLSVDQEREAILGAQAGDPEATEALLRQYGPTLRASVNRAKKTIDEDEARSVALLAFAEILESHDVEDANYADPRLASRLSFHLRDLLGKAQAEDRAIPVPKRTATRFLNILRNADGDSGRGLEICGDYGMKPDVYLSALQAFQAGYLDDTMDDDEGRQGRGRIDGSTPIWGADTTEVEDLAMVEVAFEAVDDEEARICELAYGFTEYDPVPDAEIGHRLGLTRPTVQRRRVSALDKMRKATGVLPSDD